MIKSLYKMCLLILSFSILATSYSLQPNAVLTAQRTSLAPQIDGLLTDECWKQANWQYANHIISGSGKGDELCFAVIYNDQNIYIGAK